ncbi:hypothetical protein [Scytonema sp. NUACC26]|uniref:hypothetical protein n=1 Tax=Scytonema sp. NUACC26 TaxID=3140176 RepID=UPI0034DC527E
MEVLSTRSKSYGAYSICILALLSPRQLPIYPVVVFSFDEPKRQERKQYQVEFPNLKVLEFNFTAIQLNQLNWRDFLEHKNPVAAALMVSPVL